MSAVQDLDESTFPDFVADLWERKGWTTERRSVDGESYVAAVKPEAGERGLIWAKSGSTGARVDGEGVVTFAKFCKENGVDDAAILTLGAFTEDGETAAEKFGIDLLDGEGLATVVERHDLDDLVAEHAVADDSKESNDDGLLAPLAGVLAGLDDALQFEALESPSELVAGIRKQIDDRDIEVPRQVGVATVVVVALLVAGIVVGPSFVGLGSLNPLAGGDGDAGPASMEVSAGPVQPSEAATSLYVEFNATSRTTIDVNPEDDQVHVAPNGTRFVVVGLSVVNTGDEAVELPPAAFTLSANGTTYNYQPLEGTNGYWEANLAAGDSYEGWTVFVVPEDAPSGTLGIDQRTVRGGVAVQFAPNPSMTVNVTV